MSSEADQTATRWWLVELDSRGVATRAEPVAARGEHDRTYYVEAADRAQAIERAHAAYRRRQNQRLAERRARYEAAGLCRCGRPKQGAEGKWCATCLTSHRNHRQARANGERVSGAERGQRIAQTRRSTQQLTRLATLREVQEWLRTLNREAFGRRLAQEIAKLEQVG